MLGVYGPNETLAFLATCNYNHQSIKFLTANLRLPKSIDKSIEAEKKLDLHTLTNLIYSFDLPENDVRTLKKEAIVKTQEAIGRDVQADLNKKTLNDKMEQLQISVPNYIKQIQQEPNDIETYLDTVYLRQVKEKANIRTLPSNSPSVVTSKNKDTSHHR